jgi:hypothetical protein
MKILEDCRKKLAAAAVALCVFGAPTAMAQGQAARSEIPADWTSKGVTPTGYLALDGARAFKLGLKRHGDRWYLFVGEGLGGQPAASVSIVDVTDPQKMHQVASFQVPFGNGQITLHGDLLIAGQQRPFAPPAVGGSVEHPFRGLSAERLELATLFDISDPLRPRRMGAWEELGWATHRNGYPGGRYAFMSAWISGYRGQSMLVILDVQDPKSPREAGRWWMPGQAENETAVKPAAGFHGPAYLHPDGRTLTLGYTPAIVNLDISNPSQPKVVGELTFSPLAPLSTQAIHTVAPLRNDHFLVTTEPGEPGCDRESLSFAAIVDNRDRTAPRLVAYLPRPMPEPGSGLSSFCDKEGRFGPHNVNTETHQEATEDPANIIYMTYFNAGLRIFDAGDARTPREVGWFLPKVGPWTERKRGLEDVIVDTRGNIFVSNGREKGIWSLRLDHALLIQSRSTP